MLTTKIINFLEKVSDIKKTYEKLKNETGEEFNLFNILGMTTDEVRTHSAFIGELLKTDGIHGQKDTFLVLFINQLKNKNLPIDNFECANVKVQKELHIGQIPNDYTEGGYIDLIITNNQKKAIIIENKIYAIDQEKQLLRYFNYAKRNFGDKNFIILYLTLDNSDANNISKDNLIKNNDYYLISYVNDIIPWLKDCHKEASNFPILRENIQQYIYLIKELTNQSKYNEMEKEITDIIKKNPEYVETIIELNSIVENLKIECLNQLKKEFGSPLIEVQNVQFSIEIHNDTNGFNYVFVGGNNTSTSIRFNEYENDFFRKKRKELINNTKLTSPAKCDWPIVCKTFDISLNMLDIEAYKKEIEGSIKDFKSIMQSNN